MNKIKYLGFIFGGDGRQKDTENFRASQQTPSPMDFSSLRAVLGLINYCIAFLLNLHRIRTPLNKLLQKEQIWYWSYQCQSAFDESKGMLTSDELLTQCDLILPIIVAAGASNCEIGRSSLTRFLTQPGKLWRTRHKR